MSKSNKPAKDMLIKLYGPECFIEKLHLRQDKNRHYKGKGQKKRMKQLTYHHILERRNGGKATIENGALLSAENHAWFHKQSKKDQIIMNRMFQEYKKCKIEFTDEIPTDIDLHYTMIKPSSLNKDKKNKHKKEHKDR